MAAASVPTGNTYDKYASTNGFEEWMVRGFLRTLDEMLDGLTPERVLEVGVGEGEVMARLRRRFPGVPMVGLDLPDTELASGWRAAELSCLFGDGTALPFADDTFDLVLAIEVLEHVPVPEAALRELSRVCSGRLIASVPLEPIWRAGNLLRFRYVRQFGNTPGHLNHWTRRGFCRFVGRCFDLELVRNPVPWTMVRGRVGR